MSAQGYVYPKMTSVKAGLNVLYYPTKYPTKYPKVSAMDSIRIVSDQVSDQVSKSIRGSHEGAYLLRMRIASHSC